MHTVRVIYRSGTSNNEVDIMLRITGIALLCALAAPALADEARYTFVEGFYQRTDIDLGFADIDGDGIGIGGSLEIGDMWQVIGSYSTAGLDFDVDFDQLMVGGGFHAPITDTVDLVANLMYVRVDVSGSGGDADDDGLGMSVGVRGFPVDRLELAGFIDYIDLDDSGDDTFIRGQAWYSLTPAFALGLSLSSGDDITTWGIGGRYYFD